MLVTGCRFRFYLKMKLFFITILFLLKIVLSNGMRLDPPPKPKWPQKVYAEGYLVLPYAELSEPFTAYYDGPGKRSRIDYYGGLSKTIQRGDLTEYGQHYMITPETTETFLNKISCLMLNGTSGAPVGPQHILPDISNFSYAGEKTFMSYKVDIWMFKSSYGTKFSTYTLYVKQTDQTAVYYEMMGYDTLLGSHFDEYKVLYSKVSESFAPDVFDEEIKGRTCEGFPGPGYEVGLVANPMKEFIYPEDQSHLSSMYDDFIDKYDKKEVNENPDLISTKKHTFNHNLRYINSMNRKNLSFKLKVNHLADHSPNELRKLRGRRTSVGYNNKKNNGKPFKKTMKVEDIPPEMNWRLRGAVTPVKDQAVCGSCWSFGSTGTIEGALFLKTGILTRLSQQNLIDCSWGFGNNACDGGEEFRSYEYIMKHGLDTEESYGPYLGVSGFCHRDQAKIGAELTGYVNVTSGDMNALKIAIATKGPIAVGIDAAHLSFAFYSHGVYYEPECGNKYEDLDHAVLAVGYGELDGTPYWLVKNSWSTHWGNDGYVLMSQKNNNCGVATDATFVEIA